MLTALSELERVIVDEVHELLASERGSQLSISLERLQLNSNQKITRTGLSATIGNIEDAGHFLVGTKKPCKIIRDKSMRKYDVEVKFVKGSISEVADSIIHYIEKSDINSPVLLFTNTRGESEFLSSILREKTLMNIELHHGSLSKQVREETGKHTSEWSKWHSCMHIISRIRIRYWFGRTCNSLWFTTSGIKINATNRQK